MVPRDPGGRLQCRLQAQRRQARLLASSRGIASISRTGDGRRGRGTAGVGELHQHQHGTQRSLSHARPPHRQHRSLWAFLPCWPNATTLDQLLQTPSRRSGCATGAPSGLAAWRASSGERFVIVYGIASGLNASTRRSIRGYRTALRPRWCATERLGMPNCSLSLCRNSPPAPVGPGMRERMRLRLRWP